MKTPPGSPLAGKAKKSTHSLSLSPTGKMRLCEKIALSIAVGIFASGLRVALAPLEAEPAVPSLPHQLQQKPAAKPAAAAPNATAEPSDTPQPPLDPFWTPRDDPPAETVPHYPPAQPTDRSRQTST
ncbi:hypothetical protein DIPPA_11131 [Diplonema papillatum]|nr:hypothetical protein DIPPA_11131 [Diplonema papillatum]